MKNSQTSKSRTVFLLLLFLLLVGAGTNKDDIEHRLDNRQPPIANNQQSS